MGELLSNDFMRELEALTKRLSLSARSGKAGEGASLAKRGSSAEFAEHRRYTPGDDPRRIDWLAYARSGQAMLKLFRAEEDTVVRVLVDCSGSLSFGVPSKLTLAKRFAAAIAVMGLTAGNRFQLIASNHARLRIHDPHRGRRTLPLVLRELDALEAVGHTTLTRWINNVLAASHRPGLLIVISDFLDASELLLSLERARARGHELGLVQVLDEEELNPTLEGDLVVEDAETGALLELSVDAQAMAAYHQQLAQLMSQLRDWARRTGQRYVDVTSSSNLESAVRRFVQRELTT